MLESIDDKELREWAEQRLKRVKHVTADERAKSLWLKLENFADAIVPDSKLFLKQHREKPERLYAHE